MPNNNVTGEVKSDAKPVKDQALTASRVVRPTPTETKAKMDFRKYLPLGVIAVIVVIVLVVVGFAVVKTHNDSSDSAPTNSKVTVSNDDVKKKPAKKKVTKKTTLKKGETKFEPVKDSTSDFTVQTGDDTSKLELSATRFTTASVKITGNQVWTGSLTPTVGHSVDIPKDAKEVNISLNNAPISSVKLNNKAVVMSAPAQGQSATQRQMNLKFNN